MKITKSRLTDNNGEYNKDLTKQELIAGTFEHVIDVRHGIDIIIEMLKKVKDSHDYTKFDNINMFYESFTNNLNNSEWSDFHQQQERHHLINEKYIHADVNLVDVLEYIVDGMVAGMSRKGVYTRATISNETLQKAFNNTIDLLLNKMEV